jgi:hypothetical protein
MKAHFFPVPAHGSSVTMQCGWFVAGVGLGKLQSKSMRHDRGAVGNGVGVPALKVGVGVPGTNIELQVPEMKAGVQSVDWVTPSASKTVPPHDLTATPRTHAHARVLIEIDGSDESPALCTNGIMSLTCLPIR